MARLDLVATGGERKKMEAKEGWKGLYAITFYVSRFTHRRIQL